MDTTLRELEKAFCAGLVSRRDFFRRAAFLLASTTAAFELLGRLSPRRLAWASSCITLDLSTTDLASQGYVSDGSEPFAVDTTARRLTISDNSTTGFRTFTRACPEIPTTSIDVEIILSIDTASVTLQDVDTGVHLVLFEGRGSVGITGRELRVACIFTNSERRLALFTSAGVYSQGVPFNWAAEQVFRLKRLNNGDGMIDLGGGVFEQIAHDDLAVSSLTEPAFRLGCHSANATAVATFGPIGMPVFPMTITPSIVQLFPNASEKVHIEGSFALDTSSNGINPATELVALRLFKPDGSRIYPVGTDKMPVAMVPITGGWSISAAEKTRTGIQDFQVLQTGDPSFFVFKLVDTRTSLPLGDYSQVKVDLQIADDTGTVDAALVQVNNGNWKLG